MMYAEKNEVLFIFEGEKAVLMVLGLLVIALLDLGLVKVS